MNVDSRSVAALVVTYNRKEFLVSCLDAIKSQTRPVDRVIVIDNCSTDGTPEFLAQRGYLSDSAVQYVRLTENAGPGGGFNTGMGLACEQGYDWIWTVDDDGVPLPDALARLFDCPSHILVRGSLVMSTEDPTGDAMTVGLPGPSGVAFKLSELAGIGSGNGILEGYVNPWNGVLVSSLVVKQVGLPRREFFYRYVEVEYFLRVKAAGIPIATIFAAKVFHRPMREQCRRVCFWSLSFTLAYYDDPFVFYLYVRNAAYTLLRYRGPHHRQFLKLLAYPFVFPKRAMISSRALCEGVIGRFLPSERIRAVVSKLC